MTHDFLPLDQTLAVMLGRLDNYLPLPEPNVSVVSMNERAVSGTAGAPRRGDLLPSSRSRGSAWMRWSDIEGGAAGLPRPKRP